MTEAGVFQILLKNEKPEGFNVNYAKHEPEVAKIIAKNLTDIIYQSYKRNSCDSRSKRQQILGFINNLCVIPEQHNYDDYMSCALKQLNKNFISIKEADFNSNIASDLEAYTRNIFEKGVQEYYLKKVKLKEKKLKAIDTINKRNLENLHKKYHLEVPKKYFFEHNETLIKKLLGSRNTSLTESVYDVKSTCDRDKLVKLAYSMVNTKEYDMLNKILSQMLDFSDLNNAEKYLLQYIWSQDYESIHLYIQGYIDLFHFISEQTLIKNATHLIELSDEQDVHQYLSELENDNDIIKLRMICQKDHVYYLKLKSLLYELYCISFCNENVLKLSDVIVF
ncbi:uncharacterized protein LOC114326837 [Diabrotica virgifera virgifera]|uniref:Uncharacterized protein LOC114326837 n=1 Tax=Diabrotica virgifera virgifera TaxID=50390 RepID=A0A6P7F5T6_DIAVI|nr:uncharacterized protein LOC114326837 [Diabrotica virgifera virgifera]